MGQKNWNLIDFLRTTFQAEDLCITFGNIMTLTLRVKEENFKKVTSDTIKKEIMSVGNKTKSPRKLEKNTIRRLKFLKSKLKENSSDLFPSPIQTKIRESSELEFQSTSSNQTTNSANNSLQSDCKNTDTDTQNKTDPNSNDILQAKYNSMRAANRNKSKTDDYSEEDWKFHKKKYKRFYNVRGIYNNLALHERVRCDPEDVFDWCSGIGWGPLPPGERKPWTWDPNASYSSRYFSTIAKNLHKRKK